MQPILADSTPHRGRAIALVSALAVVASLAIGLQHRPTHHRHHMRHMGKCGHATYTFAVR
jgi:hypothetical protein